MVAIPATEILSALPRADRAAACRPALEAARTAVAEAHRAGAPGDVTARAFSSAVDEVVAALFAAARARHAPASHDHPIALAAVGGYGRMELAPHSDLDLWFLVDGDRADAHAAELAEEVLYPLWDLKLDVGHAVRTIDETIDLARDDLTAQTALLDLRRVTGDDRLCARLDAEARRRLFDRDPSALVRKLVDEKAARHRKFGDTVFLLEPDLKNGEGGYRDLLVGLWAAKARFGVRDFGDLLAIGQATPRQIDALAAARRFYLTVRTAAHLYARRRQDCLLFEVQEAIAPAMAPPVGDEQPAPGALPITRAVAPAVEWLMQQYYLHAKAVTREGGRLLDRAAELAARRPRIRNIDAAFLLWNGKLSTRGPEVFADRPSEMVRLFRVALDTGAEIYGHTRDLVAEACARKDAAARLAADPDSARHFLALLVDPADRGLPSMLEQMHDLGLLVALMPEFGPCSGRVQHDLYHVFTVDQHQLYAVARLKSLERGDLADALPVATQAMHEVEGKIPLYLGTLLHDVGKPLGKSHSETGARLAIAIAARFSMSEPDTARTELLVRRHLVLAHLSQRRDLNDTAMIAHLAADLADEETLRQLYLLTIADMSMVAPENLSSWKERLLRELYARTLAHFRHGPDLAGEDRSARVALHRRRVAELVGDAGAASLDAWLAGLPDRYLSETAPRAIARHFALSSRRAGQLAVDVTHRPKRGWSELTVIADDAPGLLAKIAGALLASRVDILSAQIHSRARAGFPDEAIDVFLVRDRNGRSLCGERAQRARWPAAGFAEDGPREIAGVARIADDLARLTAGAIDVEALVAERRPRGSLPSRVTPAVATEVEVDNDVSGDFTVADVYTQDRPGVLYTITHTLSQLGLDIHLSKVATEGSRVADIFYLRGADGTKLDEPGVARLRSALFSALEALPA